MDFTTKANHYDISRVTTQEYLVVDKNSLMF
jgi:hypothetical protein